MVIHPQRMARLRALRSTSMTRLARVAPTVPTFVCKASTCRLVKTSSRTCLSCGRMYLRHRLA